MITHLIRDQDFRGLINLQYSFRKDGSGDVSSVLFMARIRDLFERQVSQGRHSYILWSTGPSTIYPNSGTGEIPLKIIKERDADLRYVGAHQTIEFRRFDEGDLIRTLGPVKERNGVVAYVCGPPPMTDYVVESLRKADGMDETRVLCEKWW